MGNEFQWTCDIDQIPFFSKTKVMFDNNFFFLFSKTYFGEYKEKNIFLFIFEIKNMFG